MSEASRIRWHDTPAGIISGHVGTLDPHVFSIWQPPQASGEWVLTSELPGMEAVRRYGDDPDGLKPLAEELLGRFAAFLGAFFPAAGEQLTCNACSHAPAAWLAVMGRTSADRSPAPGHVLRLLCDACAARTREICDGGGRAVTFIALGAAGVPSA